MTRILTVGALPPGVLDAFEGLTVLHVPPGRSDKEVFVAAVDRLHDADVLLAEASDESTALGWAVAWMLARGRLVVVCHRRGVALPSLVAGNPSPWQRIVPYADASELQRALGSIVASGRERTREE